MPAPWVYFRNMLRLSLFAAVLLAMQACTVPDPEPSKPAAAAEEKTLLERLPGKWVARESGSDHWFEEHWILKADGDLEGVGLVRSGNDTVMIEYLSIHRTDTATWYSARIPTHNQSEPVLFRMVSDKDSLSFLTPEIRHPQRITYWPDGTDGWRLKLSGSKLGDVVEELFHFQPMPVGDQPLP